MPLSSGEIAQMNAGFMSMGMQNMAQGQMLAALGPQQPGYSADQMMGRGLNTMAMAGAPPSVANP